MSASSTDPRYLLRWDFARSPSIVDEIVVAHHRLNELSSGTQQGLIDLLRNANRNGFSVHKTGSTLAHPNQLQTGLVGTVPAHELMRTIDQDQVWFCAADIDIATSAGAMVSRLANELTECHVGLRVLQPTADLEVSSPHAFCYFGCDPTPSTLWHLRGRCRVWLYPTQDNLLNQLERESLVACQNRQTPYYEPAFDDLATVIDLEPGQMLSWPYLMPYRIENAGELNVSVKLRFQTPRSLRYRNICFANQRLRKVRMNWMCGETTEGLLASLKNTMGGYVRPEVDSTAAQQTHQFSLHQPKTAQVSLPSITNLSLPTSVALES